MCSNQQFRPKTVVSLSLKSSKMAESLKRKNMTPSAADTPEDFSPYIEEPVWRALHTSIALFAGVATAIGVYELAYAPNVGPEFALAALSCAYGAFYSGVLSVTRGIPRWGRFFFPYAMRKQSRELFSGRKASLDKNLIPLINTIGVSAVSGLSYLFWGGAASILATLAAIVFAGLTTKRRD